MRPHFGAGDIDQVARVGQPEIEAEGDHQRDGKKRARDQGDGDFALTLCDEKCHDDARQKRDKERDLEKHQKSEKKREEHAIEIGRRTALPRQERDHDNERRDNPCPAVVVHRHRQAEAGPAIGDRHREDHHHGRKAVCDKGRQSRPCGVENQRDQRGTGRHLSHHDGIPHRIPLTHQMGERHESQNAEGGDKVQMWRKP